MLKTADTENRLDPDKLRELDDYIGGLERTEGELVTILHKAQNIFGYLPWELQLHIARTLGMPGAEVYGVVSFYSYFTMEPPGRHTVSVCMGTACFVRGAEKILEDFKAKLGIESNETDEDHLFTLKDVRCVGACGLAPVVMIDDKVFGRVTEEDVDKILEAYHKE